MTGRDFVFSLAFAAIWTVGMIWWTRAYTFPDIVVFWIFGEVVGFGWTLIMNRLGYFVEAK
jgi:hypothetical protein